MSDTGMSPLKRALRAIDDLQARVDAAENWRREPIAVIGVGCRLPGADNPSAFWELLRSGRDAVAEVPAERWDLRQHFDPDPDAPGKTYTRWGGFLRAVDSFDPVFFGISPREAVDMDPQQRLLLEVAWEALEHAGQAPDLLADTKTGVYVGVASWDYSRFSVWSGEDAHVTPYSATGVGHSVVSGRLSYLLGLRGPSMSIDTACSSSLVGLHLACQALRMRECRMAMAAGIHLQLAPDNTIAFCRAKMMSPTGSCKTFSAEADGIALGEGCGVLVLKRLADAVSDGDRVLAVIRGTAVNQDGASGGLTVPSGPAQQDVIRAALANAGLSPNDVTYVEAHGTGTPLGDPIEVGALAGALCKERAASTPLLIGSVKTNIGHLEAAAGISSAIKVVLSLWQVELPAHLHAEKLSPHIPWSELPIEINRATRAWPEGRSKIAGVSSFGFSGTNAHVIFEAAPAQPKNLPQVERPLHLMTLSARTPVALAALATSYGECLASGNAALADIAYTANVGRAHGMCRRAIVAASGEEFQRSLRAVAEGREDGVFKGDLAGTDVPRIAFLFTGQGAQYPGMGRRLFETQPTFRRAIEQCDAILREYLDRPLLDVLFECANPLLLGQTGYTQPALFSLEYALAELWRSWGVRPAAVLGHSLGEFVAACVAGVFSLEDGLRLVAMRGRLMQSLPVPGAMASVFTTEDRVAAAVASRPCLSIAAVNAPTGIVISGAVSDVESVCEEFAAAGVKSKRLDVSHAFHSPLMEPMLGEFERSAKNMSYSRPAIPLISNLTGEAFNAGQAPDADYWVRHVRQTVRYAASVENVYAKGYRLFLEIGPQPTLTALARQTVSDTSVTWLASLQEGHDEWRTMLESLATLYTSGARIDWRGFDRDYNRRLVSLPTYPFERKRYWVESRRPKTLGMGEGAHPLLGRRLASPVLREVVFQSQLSETSPAFIAEHRVFDTTVLPATGYIEMALSAAQAVGMGPVRDFVIHEAMIFSDNEIRNVQAVIEPEAESARALRIFSQTAVDDASSSWKLHASARLAASEPPSEPEPGLNSAKRRCLRQAPAESLYSGFAQLGITFGPRFHGSAGLWCGTNEALVRVELPSDTAREAKKYRFHPAWLDACVQALAGAAGIHEPREQMGVFLPIAIESIDLREAPSGTLWSHAVLADAVGEGAHAITGNITVYNDEGRVIAKLARIALKRADASMLAKLAGRLPEAMENWLYEPAWEPAPVDSVSEPAISAGVSPQGKLGPGARWLIFSDEGGVGDGLGARLRQVGAEPTLVTRGDSFGAKGAGRFTVNPQKPQDFAALKREMEKGGVEGWDGTVYLWALDCARSFRTTPDSLKRDLAFACGGALSLLQTVAAEASPSRVWLVTRGARSVASIGVSVESVQATLWGLGRSAALEHPECRCTNVDLSPEVGCDDTENLIAELIHGGDEDRIAWRPDGRFVERLVRRRDADQMTEETAPLRGAYALDITTRGVLDNLCWRPVDRRVPGPGEVEIEVEATALNFRDVLNAMGLYPGTPPLGGECAGRIVSVGKGVANLRAGQRVVAVFPGSFRRFVTVSSRFVRVCPNRLTAVEAVTIPIAFVTACFGLEHVAGLARGERVLIHAAAGGVGLAAIQVARSAGAEIFATAGSEAKRDYLRSLGVQHVMDSRSTAFAEEVMTRTGGSGVNVVLNSLVGEAISKSLEILAPGGRFIELGKRDVWSAERVAAVRKDVRYEVIDWGETAEHDPEIVDRVFTRVIESSRRNEFEPLPYRVFPASRVVDAFRLMAQGRHRGKIIVRHPAEAADVSSRGVRVRADSAYLVTGGFGALGLLAAKWLGEQGAGSLVLVGRREPDAAAKQAIHDLRQSGVHVHSLTTDVSDGERMNSLLRELTAGDFPLRGIVHCAGTLDDGVLLQQNWDRFERVFAAKVAGTFHLHLATINAPLDFFVAYSSIASLFGAAGQSNYAAANAYLDAIAHERSALGLPACSVNWGGWAEAGMGARTGAGRRSEMGFGDIQPADGLAFLRRLLNPARPQVAVVPIDWERFRAQGIARQPFLKRLGSSQLAGTRQAATSATVNWKEELANVPPGNRAVLLETRIATQVAKVLGLPVDSIGARRPLQEMGLDSLMAIELRNALAQGMGESLPATLLFDHPTVDALVAYLRPKTSVEEAAEASKARPEEETGDLLSRIESLSDEEVDRLLADRQAKGAAKG